MCVHQSPSPSVFGLLSWWMQFKWSWQLSCDITAMCSLVPPCFIMTPHTQHSTHHWHKTWIISCRRVRHVSKYNTLLYSPLWKSSNIACMSDFLHSVENITWALLLLPMLMRGWQQTDAGPSWCGQGQGWVTSGQSSARRQSQQCGDQRDV